MQSASDLKKRGVKRTKVTRPDGTAFVELSSPALAQTIFPPDEGFKVTEVFGYDVDLDGHRKPPPKDDVLLAPLSPEELFELTDTLWRGWHRAGEVYPIMSEDHPVPGVDLERNFNRNPIVYDLEKTYMPVVNEYWGRQLGCRWTSCQVCRHESCSFCPTCNPDGIAPDGVAYDDAEDTPTACGLGDHQPACAHRS